MEEEEDVTDDRPTITAPPPSGVSRELDLKTRRELRRLARACREFGCFNIARQLEQKAC